MRWARRRVRARHVASELSASPILQMTKRFLRKHQTSLILLIILYEVLLFYTFYKLLEYDMTVAAEQRNARHASRRKFAALSKCILSARRNFWDVLEIIIRRCMQEHMSFAALNVIHLTGDEISSQRFFLRIKKRNRLNRPSNCLWLIFGTTQTEKAQKEFMQSFPSCHVFRADHYYQQYNASETVEVESKGKDLTMKLQLTNNTYILENFSRPFIRTLIQNYLKTNKIAFVSVNMNGYEYAILEELVDPIKNNNEEIVFCQIDVILSNPDIEQLFTDEYFNFDAFIKKLIESHYVPIHAAAYLEHKKVLFVHSDDVYCLRTLDYSGFTFNNMSKHSPLSQF